MRTCAECGNTKALDSFTWIKKSKGYRAYTCKVCKSKRQMILFKKRMEDPIEKQKILDRQNKAYHENKDRYRKYAKKSYEKSRNAVLHAYGGENPECICCGEKDKRFLCVDHIDGRGNEHRRSIKMFNFTLWLKNKNFPSGFQLLCFNCNMGKSLHNNICPHKIPCT